MVIARTTDQRQDIPRPLGLGDPTCRRRSGAPAIVGVQGAGREARRQSGSQRMRLATTWMTWTRTTTTTADQPDLRRLMGGKGSVKETRHGGIGSSIGVAARAVVSGAGRTGGLMMQSRQVGRAAMAEEGSGGWWTLAVLGA